MPGDEYKTIWPSKSRTEDKSWGFERCIGSLGAIQAKILYINKGESTSLKFYTTKNEVLYIRDGEVLVEYDSEKYHYQDPDRKKLKQKVLHSGDVLYVQSNCPYRITALKDSEIFEIGDSRTGQAIKIDEEI
tara:strand:- start:1675 stop:2070 length:396 start_codon:yes stop_codon:yes gene_type:complete